MNTVSASSSGSTIPSTARTHRFSRRWPVVAGVAAAAIVASGTVAFAKAHKTVTLDVDGTTTSVSTFAGDVEGLLAAQGVRLDDQDEVAPHLDTTLRDGSDVVVRYGRQVTVATDGKESDVWLNVTDSNEALDILASRGTDVRLVASRSGERADFPLRLNDDGPVAVVADGSTRVVDSGGDGVGAILDRLDIELDKDDRVSVVSVEDLTENGGKAVKEAEVAKAVKKSDVDVALQVERVATKKVTRTITIEHRSKTVTDSSRYEDLDPAVRTAGKDGERTKRYRVTTVDGVVLDRELISNKVTTKPVTEVVVEGTKERPAPEPDPEPATSADTSSSSSSSSSASAPASTTAAVPAGSNREIGQRMAAARGWTGSQWTCLEALWTKESNWSHTAQNPSSGAYGIPQSLPGTKMATAGSDWATNPATQIEWGLGYIAGRYGTPCGAWGHSQSVGWY
ncbi:ubiquitin-like domain-containing protein [Myceligenerans salitolerans]|uniref:aggregation-promoting factor C-terminal-like domain-containing protein n=1 Tax=Myceligenerans salitolerans TaxID=1230528 RepID=UPI0027DDADAE|nr:ubiquitin-like domain-containing protein [Myceligenerans salitolerans]